MISGYKNKPKTTFKKMWLKHTTLSYGLNLNMKYNCKGNQEAHIMDIQYVILFETIS